MLKPQRKFTKKEIQQDDVIATFNKVRSFYDVNKKYVSYGLTALVIIIVASYVYIRNRNANNDKAATELGKVFSIYDAGSSDPKQYKLAIDGQPGRGIMGLKTIVDNYGGTEAGELARFYLADAYYNTGLIDEALRQFDNFSGGEKLLKASAVAGIAACNESKGNYSDAGSYFEKAAGMIADNPSAADYYSSATRCYAKAGEKEKALNAYQRLKQEFPASQNAHEAERYISAFSA
ncbi:MAG: tetratricopeptide repeat protein [Bacteroidota bacterium]